MAQFLQLLASKTNYPVTVKLVALTPDPPSNVVNVIGPVVAPKGTVTVAWVADARKVFSAETEPNLISVIPVKFPPVITTTEPGDPVVTPD